MQPQDIRITTTTVGLSAISVNTLVAKTFNVIYPLQTLVPDSASGMLFFSARQKTESVGASFGKGIFGAMLANHDSVRWITESGLYEIKLSGNNLLLSNDLKTVRYNKTHGYDEIRYDSKIFFTSPKYNKGFMYDKTVPNQLHCMNLSLGISSWSCTIPSNENWVDWKYLNDSVLIIAAGGLHAVNVKKGLLWSYTLPTSIKTNRSFVYSLAKYLTIQKISSVIKTNSDENQVTQIASNILKDDSRIYFAGQEKLMAVSHAGKLLWQINLKNFPTSKMFISKTDSSIILVNFGLATHSNNFVTWGKPFILTIDPNDGRIITQFDLSNIENLADFVKTDKALIFAGKDGIQEAKPGNTELRTVLELSAHKYGQFVEFINGNEYYVFKEGYYVPLNFINDNLIYFRADNNKIYGMEGGDLKYEYHFTELYKFDKKYQDKTILSNMENTIVTSVNFELLYTINLTLQNIIMNDKMYLIGHNHIHVLDLKELK